LTAVELVSSVYRVNHGLISVDILTGWCSGYGIGLVIENSGVFRKAKKGVPRG